MSRGNGNGFIVGIVLAIIAVAITGYLVFWGVVGGIILHFVHKFW